MRADWRFGSAVVGPRGELLAHAGAARRRAVVVARVPLGARAPTPYVARPALPEGAAVALAVVALGIAAILARPAGHRSGTRAAP